MELHEVIQQKFGDMPKEHLRFVMMEMSPCADGVKWFDDNFSGDYSDVPMEYLSWFARPYLSGADLHGANLTKAVLYAANLRGANLAGADLRVANLLGTDLTNADLSGADLRVANLLGTDLTNADLSGANLRWINLTEANLRRADLTGADLTGVDLTDAYWDDTTMWPTEFAPR